MKSAAARLRELSNKARKGDLPNREELVSMALEIGAEALENEVHWVSKGGSEHTLPKPEHGHAIKAVHVAAHIAGCLEKQPEKQHGAADFDRVLEAARQEFGTRGYDIVPRVKA